MMRPRFSKAAMFSSVIGVLLFITSTNASSLPKKEQSKSLNNTFVKKPQGRGIMTLAESIKSTMRSLEDPEVEKVRRQYWKKTLKDIKRLSFGMSDKDPLLSQWKFWVDEEEKDFVTKQESFIANTSAVVGTKSNDTLSNGATEKSSKTTGGSFLANGGFLGSRRLRRFEGFPSWERMLQEWADEVQEYMQQVEQESGTEYNLANFGRPSASKANETFSSNTTSIVGAEAVTVTSVTSPPKPEDEEVRPYVSDEDEVDMERERTRRRLPRVVPAPAKDGEPVLPHTDLSDKSKRIEIVTTASLPWKTGTAVNPLLRAAYMLEGRQEAGGSVTISLPWLERRQDQERVYGKKSVFESREEQEAYIRTWLRESAGMEDASENLGIRWYTAWQNPVENSIYSMGDITALIPAEEVDICILEEPEHLNWYRAPGESWTRKFKHVVGILHTNYFQYALDQPAAIIRAPAMRLLCSWMCRAHCHRIIKLSGTIDKVAPEKELVENVHGVRGTFLDIGKEVGTRITSATADPVFGKEAEPTIYFIGKMLWSKGLGSLMELLKYAEESAGIKVKVDMYGGGPDMEAARARAENLGLDMPFHGPLDHAEIDFSHKIFVNPSTSEVLCTTSAEALAMGKFVILPSHASNDFFAQFPNCLSYASKEEFVGYLFYAMTHSPEPLSPKYLEALSWRAATKRLEAAGCIPVAEAQRMDELHSSKEGGVEIPLPPLIDNEKRLKQISTTFRYTRHRFRQFRSRLSSEIRQNKVLPKTFRERLAADFEKQLDLDIDEILESPTLRLQLSPAELDKRLLDFYENMSKFPSGDVLRVIGGGGEVGMQNMYLRRQAMKQRGKGGRSDLFPFDLLRDFDVEESNRSTSQWVQWALRRNLPRNGALLSPPFRAQVDVKKESTLSKTSEKVNQETPKMTIGTTVRTERSPLLRTWSGLAPPPATRSWGQKSFSLLI